MYVRARSALAQRPIASATSSATQTIADTGCGGTELRTLVVFERHDFQRAPSEGQSRPERPSAVGPRRAVHDEEHIVAVLVVLPFSRVMAVPDPEGACDTMRAHGSDGVSHPDRGLNRDQPAAPAQPQADVVVDVIDEQVGTKPVDIVECRHSTQSAGGDDQRHVVAGGVGTVPLEQVAAMFVDHLRTTIATRSSRVAGDDLRAPTKPASTTLS